MLRKFNSFIEKWMALVTPTCLLLGVCFPDIAQMRSALCAGRICIYDICRGVEVKI